MQPAEEILSDKTILLHSTIYAGLNQTDSIAMERYIIMLEEFTILPISVIKVQ